MKKHIKLLSIVGLAATTLAACADTGSEGDSNGGDFDNSTNLHIVTREVGSGTRDAFAELTGLDDGGPRVSATRPSCRGMKRTSRSRRTAS